MLPVTLHCWERSQCLSFLEVFGSRGYSAGLWKTCTAPGSHSRHYKHTAACITLLHSEFHIAHLQRGSPAFSALRADPGDAARSWTAHLLDGSAAQRLHHGARQLCTPLVLLLLHRQPHREWVRHAGPGSAWTRLPSLPEPSSLCLVDLGWRRRGHEAAGTSPRPLALLFGGHVRFHFFSLLPSASYRLFSC